MATTLQLRILNGPQRGARALLSNGTHLLGTSSRADFVLRSDGADDCHAELQIGDGTILLRVLSAADSTTALRETTLKRGEIVLLGGVLLVVDEPTTPWPELAEQVASVPDLPSEIEADAEQIRRYLALRDTVEPRTRVRSSGAYGLPLAVGAAIACIPLGLLFLANSDSGAGAPAEIVTAHPVAVLRQQLRALGNTPKLTISDEMDGTIAVTGYVKTVDDRVRVTRWARELPAQTRLNLFVTDEMQTAAEETLARLGKPVKIAFLEPGNVAITGIANDASEREALLATIHEDVPGLREVDARVATLNEIASEFAKALPGADLSNIKFRLEGNVIHADGAIKTQHLSRWRQTRESISAGLAGTVTWADRVAGATEAAAAGRPSGNLRPARNLPIIALVGGPMPYILLDDGTKVLEGGSFGAGYVLQSIGARSLTIREPDGGASAFELP